MINTPTLYEKKSNFCAMCHDFGEEKSGLTFIIDHYLHPAEQ